jgi:hypothetical protein
VCTFVVAVKSLALVGVPLFGAKAVVGSTILSLSPSYLFEVSSIFIALLLSSGAASVIIALRSASSSMSMEPLFFSMRSCSACSRLLSGPSFSLDSSKLESSLLFFISKSIMLSQSSGVESTLFASCAFVCSGVYKMSFELRSDMSDEEK